MVSLYLKRDELEAAEKAAKKILRLDSGSEVTHELLRKVKCAYCIRGRAELRQNRLASAKITVDKVLRLDSDYRSAHELAKEIRRAYYDQGITFLERSQYNKAISSFEGALTIDPDFTEAHCGIVRSYLYAGALASAEAAMRENLNTKCRPARDLLMEIKDAYYNFGILYLRQGKFTDAEKAIKKVLRLDSSNESLLKVKDMYCDQGRVYLRQDKFEFAEKTVRAVLRLDADYESGHKLLEKIKYAYYNHGCVCYGRNGFESAEKAIREVLRLDSSYGPARELLKDIKHIYHARGTIFFNEEHGEEVNSDFQRAAAIAVDLTKTGLVKAYHQLGDFYLSQCEPDRAHAAIAEVLRLDSGYAPVPDLLERLKYAYCERGRVYLNQGKLEDAEKAIGDALRLDPDFWSAHELLKSLKQIYYNRVLDFLNEDQYDAAIASLENLLTMDPDFADAKWINVLTYLAQGDLMTAEKTVREILEIDPNNYWFDSDDDFASVLLRTIKHFYYNQGVTLLEENRYSDAIINLENAIAIDVNFMEAYVGLRDAYLGFEGELGMVEEDVGEVDMIEQVKKLGEII